MSQLPTRAFNPVHSMVTCWWNGREDGPSNGNPHKPNRDNWGPKAALVVVCRRPIDAIAEGGSSNWADLLAIGRSMDFAEPAVLHNISTTPSAVSRVVSRVLFRRLPRRYGIELLLIACIASPAHGQSSKVNELLQKVASRYGAIHNYVIVVKRKEMGGREPIPADHAADFRGGLVPPMEFVPPVAEILIPRSGPAFHFQIGPPNSRMLWISDGRLTWHYRPDLHEYTEHAAQPAPTKVGPGPGLPGIEWRYFTRFRAIGDMTDRARLVKDDVHSDDTCPGTYAIVDLQIKTGVAAATEELHVLTKSGLVCKSIVRRRRVDIFRGSERIEYYTDTAWWTYRQISGAVDPNLFTFVPPKEAKQVSSFR